MENFISILEMGWQFNFYGIPIHISFWTTALVVLVLWHSRQYIMDVCPGSWHCSYWLAAVCATIAMLVSLTLHEANHALAAYALSDGITEAGMSWWGAYVVPTTNVFEANPLITIMISIVGPLTNIIIGFLLLVLVKTFKESLFENTFQYISIMNFEIGILNMLPIFVLDGGKTLFGTLHLIFSRDTSFILVSAVTFITVAYLIFRPANHFRPSIWFRDLAEEKG